MRTGGAVDRAFTEESSVDSFWIMSPARPLEHLHVTPYTCAWEELIITIL